MNVPVDEVKEIMGEIGGRGMGYLFENMEKMDIQAERRNTQREKERADTTELEIQRLKKELEKRILEKRKHVTENQYNIQKLTGLITQNEFSFCKEEKRRHSGLRQVFLMSQMKIQTSYVVQLFAV